jgi:hypothetical protein
MELEYDKALLLLHPLGITVTGGALQSDDCCEDEDAFRMAPLPLLVGLDPWTYRYSVVFSVKHSRESKGIG